MACDVAHSPDVPLGIPPANIIWNVKILLILYTNPRPQVAVPRDKRTGNCLSGSTGLYVSGQPLTDQTAQ